MLIRFPFTGYHHTGGLREYIRGLEIEQAMADHFSLYNFRLRSGSNRGIVYWSFNKGGPLFQFGAVDYRLRPLMSHYMAVSYTHLRAHETDSYLVCRLLL